MSEVKGQTKSLSEVAGSQFSEVQGLELRVEGSCNGISHGGQLTVDRGCGLSELCVLLRRSAISAKSAVSLQNSLTKYLAEKEHKKRKG